MNYIESLINEGNNTYNAISNSLQTSTKLINLTDASKQLSELQTAIVKTVYLNKIFYLEELTLLYIFAACKQTIAKAVLDLEKIGYLKSSSTEYGKALVLTSKGIGQLKQDNTNINADDFNSHLLKFKILSSISADTIFTILLNAIIRNFINEDKSYRKEYAKLQYIKNYIYKDFLNQSEAERKQFLSQILTDQALINKYSILSLYSSTFSDIFAKAYLEHYSSAYIDSLESFQNFRCYITSQCLRNLLDRTTAFHFLKDYYISLGYQKTAIIHQSYSLFHEMTSNTMRHNDISLRQYLLQKSDNSSLLQTEYSLFLCNRYHRILETQKRIILKQCTEQSSSNAIVIQQAKQIKELENALSQLDMSISKYKDILTFVLYESTKESGLNIFQEQVITLDSLRQNGIYIRSINDTTITFCIVPTDKSSFTYSSLFKKIERIFVFHHYCIPKLNLKIEIICYASISKEDVLSLITKVKQKFAEIKEYQLLSTDFSSILSISDTEFHFKERFEVFPTPLNP